MTGDARIRPGVPDDDNRHYLPEYLKGSDVVVNENGNNSQPYPPRLQEMTGTIVAGATDRWYTYVPESYDPVAPCPLVISLHGGLMTGWGQAVYSSWTNVADREGFVVIFPDAGSRRFWSIDMAPEHVDALTAPNPEGLYLNPPARTAEENHDIRLIRALIDWAADEYSIDRERVFLQGMSMGESMTSTFVRAAGSVLAGAAGSGAPIDPSLLFTENGDVINEGGPIPMWQSRLDLDAGPQHYATNGTELVRQNLDYWLRVNGVRTPPTIAVRGVDNFAFYRGEFADVVFRDVHGRDHGQTFDDAQLVWDHLFSGVRRAPDGSVRRTRPELELPGDAFAVAVAEGCGVAWVSGERVRLPGPVFRWQGTQYHGRAGEPLVRVSSLYVPSSLLATVFGAELDLREGGDEATLRLADGRVVDFARGNVGILVDGRVRAMRTEAVRRDGELWVSLEWFAATLFDLHVTTHSNVVYVTDHHAQLGGNMAVLIRELLSAEVP